MTLKKLISAVIVFALVLCTLTSCDLFGGKSEEKAEELVAEAEAALKNQPYSIDMKVKYASNDEGMKNALSFFADPEIKVVVNGGDFKIGMELMKGGLSEYYTYTLFGGKLYSEYQYGDYRSCNELEYGAGTVEAIRSTLGAGANVSEEDFKSLSVNTSADVTVVTYTEINDEALSKLVAFLQEQLTDANALVTIKNVSLVVEIVDGKYDVTALECEYHITTIDSVYTLKMTFTAKFNYEGDFTIAAPELG